MKRRSTIPEEWSDEATAYHLSRRPSMLNQRLFHCGTRIIFWWLRFIFHRYPHKDETRSVVSSESFLPPDIHDNISVKELKTIYDSARCLIVLETMRKPSLCVPILARWKNVGAATISNDDSDNSGERLKSCDCGSFVAWGSAIIMRIDRDWITL